MDNASYGVAEAKCKHGYCFLLLYENGEFRNFVEIPPI